MHPASPRFPPLNSQFPCDWLTGRSLQAFIAPHSSSQLAALLHSTRLPGHCPLCTVPGCLSASCTGLLQLVILPSPLVSASSWFYPDAIGLNINNGQWKELCRKIRHSIIFQTQICNLASHRLQRFQPLQCLAMSSTKRAPLAFSC